MAKTKPRPGKRPARPFKPPKSGSINPKCPNCRANLEESRSLGRIAHKWGEIAIEAQVVYRQALTDLLALYARVESGEAGWSHADTKRLAEIRALVGIETVFLSGTLCRAQT